MTVKGRTHDLVARRALERGHQLAMRGRAKAAEIEFNRALARDHTAAYGFFYRASLRVCRGDEAGALADLDLLLALPARTFVRYREFEIPLPAAFPNFEASVDAFIRRTGHPFAFVMRAFLRRASMRYAEAVRDMESAVASAKTNAGLRAILSRVRFVNHLPPKSLLDLKRAARLDPTCGWIRAWSAEALRHHRRLKEASAQADLAVRLDPHYFRSYAWRGGIRRLLGRPADALDDFDRALAVEHRYWWGVKTGGREADPNLSWVLNERALVLRELGRVGEAVRSLNDAHRLNSRYGWIRPTPANDASMQSGDSELSRWLDRRPQDAWARAWRGWVRLEMGRAQEALSDLEAAAGVLPKEAWPALWRARALFNLGKRRDALDGCARACRLDVRYAPARAWRGGMLRAQGQLREALQDLRISCDMDPVLSWAWAWQGECLLQLGMPRESLEPLRRATSLDPQNADASVWQAQALAQLSQREAALDAARRALELRPHDWRTLLLLAQLSGQKRDLDRAFKMTPSEMIKTLATCSRLHMETSNMSTCFKPESGRDYGESDTPPAPA